MDIWQQYVQIIILESCGDQESEVYSQAFKYLLLVYPGPGI